MQKILILLAALSVGMPAATTARCRVAESCATDTATDDPVIILTGPNSAESPFRFIDEYFRDLLQYEIHGSQHTYRVIVGQTTMEELAALEDVAYEEINRCEGKVTRITLAGSGITFRAGDDSDRIVSVEYGPANIPPVWNTRYAIDRNVLSRPERRVELGTAGIEWVQSSEASYWTNAYEEYAVMNGDEKTVCLTMFLDGSDLSLIRVELLPDDQGRYPGLAVVSKDGRIGGFLQQSFTRLRLEQTEPTISFDETLNTTSLSCWTLVNRPLGILPGRATCSDVRKALARHPDWKPERIGSSEIRLTPENGYDLAFEGEVPEARVVFSDLGDTSPVRVFSFTFHFTRGEYFMDDVTDTTLRLNAERLAMRIVDELRSYGYSFDELVRLPSGKQLWSLRNPLRNVGIYVLQQTRFQDNDTYSVLVRVWLPASKQN